MRGREKKGARGRKKGVEHAGSECRSQANEQETKCERAEKNLPVALDADVPDPASCEVFLRDVFQAVVQELTHRCHKVVLDMFPVFPRDGRMRNTRSASFSGKGKKTIGKREWETQQPRMARLGGSSVTNLWDPSFQLCRVSALAGKDGGDMQVGWVQESEKTQTESNNNCTPSGAEGRIRTSQDMT